MTDFSKMDDATLAASERDQRPRRLDPEFKAGYDMIYAAYVKRGLPLVAGMPALEVGPAPQDEAPPTDRTMSDAEWRESVAQSNTEAIEFMKRWPTQRMHLWSKIPDGKIEAHTFDRTDEGYTAAGAWITERNGKANLYFVVNDISVTLGVDKREDPNDGNKVKTILAPRETDVTRMVGTQVDSDPRANLNATTPEEYAAHYAAEKSRLLSVYDAYDPRVNVILFSGGGVQGFHLFRDPVQIEGDPTRIAEWKRANVALKRSPGFAGSDDCESLQHVMRLPGTENLPDERKRKRGRSAVKAYLVRFDDRDAWHDAATMPKAEPDPAQDRYAGGFTSKAKYDRIGRDDPALKGLDAKWLDLGISGDIKDEYLGTDGKIDRSRAAYAFATAAKRVGIADDVLARCLMDPGWKIGECIRDKGGETRRQLKRLIERATDATVDDDLAVMNAKHCVIDDIGGVCVVVNEAFDLKRKRAIVTFSTFGALKNRYANKKKKVGTTKEGEPIYQPLADWWIHNPRHRQMNQVTFAPNQDIPGAYNVLSGFSVEPAAGDCSLYLAHLHDNICADDEKLYEYFLDWQASGVQHPENPGRAAISLRGDPGDGKGVAVQGYGRIYGRHYLQVTQHDHLVGKFNAHEGEAVLIYADEVAFSSNAQAARVFKTKISEDTKLLERKGFDSVEVDNYARYIFSTNEVHPLQIEHNDRRYLAIHVRTNPLWAGVTDRQKAADIRHEYFQPIVDQMASGGRAALLRMLLDRDITKFNAEAFPRTEEGRQQILLSAPAGDKIIIDIARDGRLPGALAKRPWIAQARGDGNLFDSMQRRGDQRMRTCAESHLTDILKDWEFKSHPLGYANGWAAPALVDLRAAIDRKYPGSVEWDPRIAEWSCGERPETLDERPAQDEIPF